MCIPVWPPRNGNQIDNPGPSVQGARPSRNRTKASEPAFPKYLRLVKKTKARLLDSPRTQMHHCIHPHPLPSPRPVARPSLLPPQQPDGRPGTRLHAVLTDARGHSQSPRLAPRLTAIQTCAVLTELELGGHPRPPQCNIFSLLSPTHLRAHISAGTGAARNGTKWDGTRRRTRCTHKR
jgi:hypothetical protein